MSLTPDAIFSFANTAALLTWVALALLQRHPRLRDTAVIVVVTVFALIYVGIIASRWAGSSGGFSSLPAVAALFSDPWLLLAGWIHYLAFDLLVGRWETEDAAARGISPWLVVPCLGLTFMFGPAGWLAYRALRAGLGRSKTAA